LKTILALNLAAASAFGQVSIGIQIGAPPPPRVVRVLPARPAPDFVWIEGYWYPVGSRYNWHAGYWTRPVYVGSRWVAPRYEGGRYYAGFGTGTRAAASMITAGIRIEAAISGNTITVRVGDAVTAKIASRRPASLGCLHLAYRFCPPLLAARMPSSDDCALSGAPASSGSDCSNELARPDVVSAKRGFYMSIGNCRLAPPIDNCPLGPVRIQC